MVASLDLDFKKNLEYLKKGLLNEEGFGKANTLQRDDRAQTESRMVELRTEFESAESRQANASALPSRSRRSLSRLRILRPARLRRFWSLLTSATAGRLN